MSPLKPWHKVIAPREDLREGRPLDASEFAVHLDHVRSGKAPVDYQDPGRFFERTFLTQNLQSLASEVLRRLSGVQTETSAVFNMSTQFGGGKTHALTLLYHLATTGKKAKTLTGVSNLLQASNVATVPHCATAVFVGTEFDSLTGRGGNDGTPVRKTPWGEIAWQLGGTDALAVLSEHETKMVAPAGDVLERILPKDQACLILMDEIMNYVSRSGKEIGKQFYNFLHNISEFARSRNNTVLAVSVPASELEMNADDYKTFETIKKLLDRLGKSVIMSTESETSEIIRRRLFEWGQWNDLKKEAKNTAKSYADWILAHRQQIPQWFPIDDAVKAFEATYPFHPSVISVFERKWRSIPRFQQTRGVLRLLALWVSDAYQKGFNRNLSDSLICLGTAPLENSLFRTALFEQLGEPRLEGAVTTDICGKADSHADRLDKEANSAIKKTRLHRKIASSIFFESNGGQTQTAATVPEIRLAVSEPGLDVGNVETALESLGAASYYLLVDGTKYRFSISPNLNKLLADRRANISDVKIEERIRAEIQKVFTSTSGAERIFFPKKSIDISDKGVLTFVILPPEQCMEDRERLMNDIERWTREYGTGVRRFKSALVWAVADSPTTLQNDARKLLAWEEIQSEAPSLRLDEVQSRQLRENLQKSQRDLKESVWRSYKNLLYLGKDGSVQRHDLGLVHSSAADTLLGLYLHQMRQRDDVTNEVNPNFLLRNWPPALAEWSTKGIKEVFFASPGFPRLLKPDVIVQTLSQGINDGRFAYVGKKTDGKYESFHFMKPIATGDIEITDDMFIIRKETAEEYQKSLLTQEFGDDRSDSSSEIPSEEKPPLPVPDVKRKSKPEKKIHRLSWAGDIPHQKWMNFYSKVLTKLIPNNEVHLTVQFKISSPNGISSQTAEDAANALGELGLGSTLNQSDDE